VLGVLLPFVLFVLVMLQVKGPGGFSFEEPLLLSINQNAAASLDRFFAGLTELASPKLIAGITIGLALILWFLRRRWQGVYLFVAVGGASALNYIIKPLVGRDRPQLWLSPTPETSFSFPSGHSNASMALGLALILLAWPTRWRWPVLALSVIFIALIGFSRLYLGVHYPSDVLAGWTLAAVWSVGLYLVVRSRLRAVRSPARHRRS
jgi:undecaprenyl-diphosphatase